jgi:outer membrane protein OmpA-like peptidoglycan-associated protein
MRRVKSAAAVMVFALLVSAGLSARAQEQEHPYSIQGQAWGDIYFGTLSAELDAKAMSTIGKLYALVKGHPGSMVFLAGYDDQRTETDTSIQLGWQRVNAVRDYLVSLGMDGDKIKTISFGNTHIALPGEGEAVWSKNRRVRYRVIPPTDDTKMEGRPSGVCQRCKK